MSLGLMLDRESGEWSSRHGTIAWLLDITIMQSCKKRSGVPYSNRCQLSPAERQQAGDTEILQIG
eukprot:1137949-Pelagomonas_calceolata.AAC.2